MISQVLAAPVRGARAFLTALERAKSSVAEGGAIEYMVEQCPYRGRIIKLQTANGWSPYPLFVERSH